MCKGRLAERIPDLCEALNDEEGSTWDDHVHQGSVCCELCVAEASLYCQADDAFLCRKCDKRVHSANFLAQRHIRCVLCSTCHSLTHRYLIGASVEVLLPIIVGGKERNQKYDSNAEPKHSKQLKRPFLFL